MSSPMLIFIFVRDGLIKKKLISIFTLGVNDSPSKNHCVIVVGVYVPSGCLSMGNVTVFFAKNHKTTIKMRP